MSGICGFIFPGPAPEVLEAALETMNEKLRHRGPDDWGILVENGVALGHRRLAIIDPEGGKQPMVDPRGYGITFDGAIYNYRSVRRELESRGERFTTESDTEVLLKAYIVWGEACLEKLNGMFALAVANFRDRSLWVARDRLGIKPLYYSRFSGGLAFASEINALLSCPWVGTDLDLSLIPFYLSHGYFPGKYTPCRQIERLPAGHILRASASSVQTCCYWDIEAKYAESGAHRITPADEEELGALIQDAVELCTVSHQPLGAFLSGGMDTGLVTAKAATLLPFQLQTFTLGVPEVSQFDETGLAALVARRYGTDHHQTDLTAEDVVANHEPILAQFGQPFGDCSAAPTYLSCRAAGKRVKAILSGDGGDMIFGGSRSYRRYLQLRRYRALVSWEPGKTAARALLGLSGKLLAPFSPQLARRFQRYAPLLKAAPELVFRDITKFLGLADLAALAGERLQPYLDAELIYALQRRPPGLHLDGIMLHDLKNFLVDDILTKVDTMSMAVGLEVRTPLLDHRLVEKAVTLSWRDKISSRRTKVMQRRLFAAEIPLEVRTAAKRGFGIPIAHWLRHQLHDSVWEVLLSSSCRQRGILNPTAVQAILAAHEDGRADYGQLIWIMLSLEKWFLQMEGT